MITQDSIHNIESSLKYSIKEYFPLKDKILLYDALVFCSLVSQTKMFCLDSDIIAFKTLRDNCLKLEIPLESYLSCAYNYISKYCKPGHRLGLGYFLNDAVVEYCATKMDDSNGGSLLVEIIKDDLLTTEKLIRTTMTEYEITYEMAFANLLKKKRLSSYFLAYKKFCGSSLVSWYNSSYINNLIEVLEPFFTYILAKNHIYTPYKVSNWNNSKIEDFSFCPIYFKDRYITNELVENGLGNEATQQGTAVHLVFEEIIGRYKTNKKKDLKAIAERYFKSKAFKEVEEFISEHVPSIKEMFLNENSFIHLVLTPDTEILLEHTMFAKIDGVSFTGTADLILVNGTKAHILDYKTSKLDPKYLPKNNKKYAKQLSLYAKLFQTTRPEITELEATVIYTRGLIAPLDINPNIHVERARDIDHIKKSLRSGVLIANEQSCFLCRHPNCKFRKRESIWAEDGTRKNKELNKEV